MQIAVPVAILVLGTLIAPVCSATIPVDNPPQPSVTSFPPTASSEARVHRLFNSSRNDGFENLVIGSNGQILATTAFPSAHLYYIDPLSIRPPVLLHNFTSASATTGITELEPNRFYVAASGVPGQSNIYSVDMRSFVVLPDGTISTPPKIVEIGNIPSAVALNGMTYINRNDKFVLIADTILGGVWKFNVETGKSSLIIQDPTMEGPPNKTAMAAFGINGVRVQNHTLFYTNSGAQTMHKMALHRDGSPAGKAILVASGLSCDDFALDPWGIAYVASPSNALIRVDTRTGAQLVVAGTFDDTVSDIIGATSVRFGTGASDRTSVYITTNGGSFTDAAPGSQGISRIDVGDLAALFGVSS